MKTDFYDNNVSCVFRQSDNSVEIPFFVEMQIEMLLDAFDFKKVEMVMKALGWEWYFHDKDQCPSKVPSISELVEKTRELLCETYREMVQPNNTEKEKSISTGGFRVTCELLPDFHRTPYFTIEFILTSWCSPC